MGVSLRESGSTSRTCVRECVRACVRACVPEFAACSGNGTWHLVSGGEVVGVYATRHLRISFVWRSRCFATPAERDSFAATQVPGAPDMLRVNDVIDTLVADMRRRYVWRWRELPLPPSFTHAHTHQRPRAPVFRACARTCTPVCTCA